MLLSCLSHLERERYSAAIDLPEDRESQTLYGNTVACRGKSTAHSGGRACLQQASAEYSERRLQGRGGEHMSAAEAGRQQTRAREVREEDARR